MSRTDWGLVDRNKALAVLREITKVLTESANVDHVSLQKDIIVVKNEKTEGYSIKIRCNYDETAWEAINPILRKNTLKIKFADGFAIVYNPR